jgi:hypothetical protein
MQAQVRQKQEQVVQRYQKQQQKQQQARNKRSLGAAYIPQELLQLSSNRTRLGVVGRGHEKNAALTI